jgi:cation diffusion facilitator CzcD-associated flavoprotein CzcO
MKEAKKHPSDYECDYLAVGIGTAGMSFFDTLLTESISAKVILVDRNDKPGGHWTTAYPFVRLHQPSGNYGVNSEPLGKSLNKKGYEKLDPNDRATGKDVVKYYVKVLDKFKTSYRFKSFFRT